MIRFMIRWAMLVCLTMVCVAAGPRLVPLKSGDPFVGTWTVTVTPNGDDANKTGIRPINESLVFTSDKMTAKTLGAKGFGPGDYQEDVRAMGPATFTCTQTSGSDGKLEWSGMTTGQDLTGTMVWTRKDGTVIHYDLQGNKGG